MALKYPFYAKVICVNPEENQFEYVQYSLLGFCDGTYADAAFQLDKYFGEEITAIDYLEIQEENSLMIMPDKWCRQYVDSDKLHYIPYDFQY